jgi:hypothetical protein
VTNERFTNFPNIVDRLWEKDLLSYGLRTRSYRDLEEIERYHLNQEYYYTKPRSLDRCHVNRRQRLEFLY